MKDDSRTVAARCYFPKVGDKCIVIAETEIDGERVHVLCAGDRRAIVDLDVKSGSMPLATFFDAQCAATFVSVLADMMGGKLVRVESVADAASDGE